jgi:Protein of unknown function (DUF3040)
MRTWSWDVDELDDAAGGVPRRSSTFAVSVHIAAGSWRWPMSDDDHDNRAIEEIERALRAEDPSLVRRFRDVEQRLGATDIAVFSLLAASVVLLSVGLATASAAPWYIGAVAYGTCFVVDHQHKRRRPRARG